MTRLPRTLTLALLASLLAACQPKGGGEASPTEVRTDGGFRWTLTRLRNVSPTQQFEWLNNETILLIGVDNTKTSGLFAWDRKGKARLVLPNAYRLCFDGETWRAIVSTVDKKTQKRSHTRYQINPTSLKATRIGPVAKHSGHTIPSFYTCNEEHYPNKPLERQWIPLRPKDGHLEFGSKWEHPEATRYEKPGAKEKPRLDLRISDATKAEAHYSRYRNAYIIYDAGFTMADLLSWQASGIFTIYALVEPGRVQPIVVRSGPWSEMTGGDRAIRISRDGIVVSSKGGSRRKEPISGIYLILSNQTFIKLDNELIESPTISPDGCNLAYRRTGDKRSDALISTNLCPNTIRVQ